MKKNLSRILSVFLIVLLLASLPMAQAFAAYDCKCGTYSELVLDNGLTERHARAVLRLPENRRSEALITIAKRKMNARATDLYIAQLLNAAAPGRHRISMVKDVRIFVNTIDHAIRLMTDNGVPATAHREERDGYIEYTVRIPTAAAQR